MSDLSTRIRARLSMRAVYGIVLLLIFGIALSLRVCLPEGGIFVGDWVRFQEVDPWYHMRLVENLVQHFPHRIAFDPYTLYPTGQDVPFAPFFDLLLGFVIWIVGLGSPTQQTIETVGAYFPAILGALVTIPVYFIGKELFNRNVGLLSAALVAILPGEFLFRSLLGFTDHHVAEVLFSAITILFLILALKSAKEKGTSFSHIWSRDWKNLRKPLIYTLLTGLALGIYILSWYGGLLFVFIIAAYMIIQYIVDHLRGRSTDYLCIIGSPSFLIALIMIIPFLHQGLLGAMHLASLAIGALALLALSGLSRLMATRNIRRAYYPLGLAGLGLAGLGGLYIIAPSLLSSMVGAFGIFAPQGGALTISEVRPFLFLEGVFSLQPAWNYFTTNFFIAFISLGLIIYAVIKEWSAEKILFLAWSLIMLGALLGQVRFAYYFAVNVALLSGYFCWRIPGWISRIFEWIGFRERAPEPKRGEDRAKKKKKEKRKVDKRKKGRAKQREEPGGGISRYLRPRYVSGVLAIVVVFFLAFYPNIEPAMNTARHPAGPGEDWHDSLVWLRDNTPDPFEDPDFYYELYERPPVGEGYDYPESAYGVMSWWDYGHWIMRIAHRIPNSNPFQAGAREAALFFTAQDESSANELLDERGSKYVIIDFEMATTKFYAMAIWAGESQSQFFEVYYQRTAEAELSPIMLYYPEYYQSMCSRLYNFGGEAVVPSDSTWVISYAERTDAKGNRYKEITTAKLFSTYEEAKAFLDSQTSPNYRIVGADPFVSSVPLEELAHYELIHKSDSTAVERGDETISYVEIFEYTP